MTLGGIGVVARQEFRLRIRTGRWRWLLGAWLLVVTGVTALLYEGVHQNTDRGDDGAVMYGGLMLFVLALAALVAPALAAQSVNGDRDRGVLATLQVTSLSAGEIAVGKLVAAWGTALAFLALTLPDVMWCVAAGGVQLKRVASVSLIVALLLGVICAIALALSALLRRTTTSAVLSYLSVFALSLGTLIVFGLVSAATAQKVREPITSYVCGAGGSGQETCHEENTGETYESTQWRTDRTWWLLAPNPFVVLADAAPQTKAQKRGDSIDPLGGMRDSVRGLRVSPQQQAAGKNSGPPVWPYGLGFDLALAAGAVWLTARRLRTPTRKLARGARIA
jgi:ABC-type transport system involved in multi-copper enzyme maturation permease subunit